MYRCAERTIWSEAHTVFAHLDSEPLLAALREINERPKQSSTWYVVREVVPIR